MEGIDSPETEENAVEAAGSRAIDVIAARTGVGRDHVRAVYEQVFSEMEREARIKDFVAIFAVRKVERLLVATPETA